MLILLENLIAYILNRLYHSFTDQEQLPPMLLDLLDEAGATDLFHQGCVIAEIRDYRRCNSDPLSNNLSSSFSDTRHVLLKPTMQV